eukprot:GHUV01057303.1.p1 GENE.GHUV01057303.1~~GHUV01057303.1.p1  ORF type:complete len:104 (-),score=14.00 GHUV01057303.1:42-353(-)
MILSRRACNRLLEIVDEAAAVGTTQFTGPVWPQQGTVLFFMRAYAHVSRVAAAVAVADRLFRFRMSTQCGGCNAQQCWQGYRVSGRPAGPSTIHGCQGLAVST